MLLFQKTSLTQSLIFPPDRAQKRRLSGQPGQPGETIRHPPRPVVPGKSKSRRDADVRSARGTISGEMDITQSRRHCLTYHSPFQEYLLPLQQLNDNMRVRTEVAGILRQFRLENIQHKFESEEQAAKQNYEVSRWGPSI